VKEIADYLKKYPEAKVTVTGYADKGTGSTAINNRLANNRANTVVNALVNQYGISKSRIVSSSKGDSEQPYSENAKNRVAICIAE
jgi:outer membrane protein OmpA-like peptidoglycan-associated protein